MLEALRLAKMRPPVEVAISRQEEVGLLGIKNLDFSLLSARRGFLLDNDTLDTIVIGGPSYFAIDVDITGALGPCRHGARKRHQRHRGGGQGHRGLAPGRLDHETTANVGVIKGGMIRNGVPDATSFLAECRSLRHEKAQALAAEMESIIRREAAAVGAQVQIKTNNLCQAVQIAPDAWTVKTAQKALATVGISAKTTFITGFTDASIYNNQGIEMAVVGIGARDEHSTSEHIHIADMEKALTMLIEILKLSAA